MVKMILTNVPELNLAYKNVEGKNALEIAKELQVANKIETRVLSEIERAYQKYEKQTEN